MYSVLHSRVLPTPMHGTPLSAFVVSAINGDMAVDGNLQRVPPLT